MKPNLNSRHVAICLLACLTILGMLPTGPVTAATGTAVSISPQTETVETGDQVTFDVVVESADGGVGAYTASVTLDNSSVGDITDVSLSGSPGLSDVDIAPDGSSADVNAALMDTDDIGSVVVATVTIETIDTGASGVSLDVTALGDEEGNSYSVTGTGGASITVEQPGGSTEPPEGVNVNQVPGSATVSPGDQVTVQTTVNATGLNAPALDVDLPAGWSIIDQSAQGPSTYKDSTNEWVWLAGGEYTVTYTVAVPATTAADSHSISATGSAIDPATGEFRTDVTASTITIEAGGSVPTDGPTVIVESASVSPGAGTTVDVTLSEVPNGLAGHEVVVEVGSTSVAQIEGAAYPSTLELTSPPSISEGGGAVELKAVDIEEAVQDGETDVTLATVDIVGIDPGQTSLTVDVHRLDDDDGNVIAYSTVSGTVSVQPPPVAGNPHPTDPDGDGAFEDVNGNGVVDFNDVVTLFNNLDEPAIQDNVELYDFNGNGRIEFDDVVTLYEEV